MDAFDNNWYSRYLRAAHEPRLRATRAPTQEVIRFTWIPSFHPGITVRVEERVGSYHLEAKRFDVAHRSKPPAILQTVRRDISPSEWAAILHHLDSARFWSMPSAEPQNCPEPGDTLCGHFDGSQWIIERADVTRYHYVDRWSVYDYPDYLATCFCLLALSGLPTDDLDGYVHPIRLTCG
jgi:hypothetical protein